MRKLNKIDIAILIAIVVALPFVFKPDLMTESLDNIFQFIVLSVAIVYIISEAWNYFRK